MEWHLLLQLSLLTILPITCVHGQTDVKITQIVFSDSDVNVLEICWEDDGTVYLSAQLIVLENPGGVTESPIIGSSTTDNNCFTFTKDASIEFIAGNQLCFVLNLFLTTPYTKIESDGQGMVRMTWPDLTTLPKLESANKVGRADDNLGNLRVSYLIPNTEADVLVVDDDAELNIMGSTDLTKNPVYYIFFNPLITPTELKVCRNTEAIVNSENDKQIRFCRLAIQIGDATAIEPTVLHAILENTGKTTVKTKPSLGVTCDKFEAVNYHLTEGTYKLSDVTAQDFVSDAVDLYINVNSYEPGTKTINILVVGYLSTGDPLTMLESVTLHIKDYNLEVENIFTSMIEMRWVVSIASTFHINITCDQDLSGTFSTAEVTCGVNPTGCFGYFLDIPPSATCSTYLQPLNEEGLADEMNIIAGSKSPADTSRRNFTELQIKDVQMTWQQEDREASTRVCFKHASHNVTATFSHYEFVIVNKIGKWLKHKLISQDTEGDICFSPFIVNSETFDITEGATLVVTQRAEDGLTVLASGETRIKFN